MPAITATDVYISGAAAVTETTLDGATDSFEYTEGRRALLLLRNPTAGALTPVIDGDGASSVHVPGVGSVDVSAGFSVGSIAADEAAVVHLDSIKEYLSGTIAITDGTGLVASLLEFQ